MIRNSNVYHEEQEVKDINNDRRRRKQINMETPSNITTSNGSLDRGHQRRGRTAGLAAEQQRETVIERVEEDCTKSAMKGKHSSLEESNILILEIITDNESRVNRNGRIFLY